MAPQTGPAATTRKPYAATSKAKKLPFLTWDTGGYILWYKRLELGRFKLSRISKEQKTISLDAAELSMLLDGIDFSRVRRSQKWQPPQKNATVLEPVADHV